MTQTVRPSVTGDGEDIFCLRSMWLPPAMAPFHSTLPVFRSSDHSSSSPVASAVPTFRKMVSPQIIGVEPLRPGIGSFHVMFSVVLHLMGRPFSLLTPFSDGPRHCGQFSADNVTAAATATIPVADARLISELPPALEVLTPQNLCI